MSLPLDWVDMIFQKLTLLYGRDFIGRWEGLKISDVKTDWSHELAGFENWPEAISHALATLPPGKPPTVLEFRELARKAPRKKLVELPAPDANPELVAAELEKSAQITGKTRMRTNRIDHKAWARRLIAREQAGEILIPATSKRAHDALRNERGGEA